MISTKVFLSKVHGFYMTLVTRSSLKSKNTLVSQKILDYFFKTDSAIGHKSRFNVIKERRNRKKIGKKI